MSALQRHRASTAAGSAAVIVAVAILLKRLSKLRQPSFNDRRRAASRSGTPLTTPQIEQAQRELYVPQAGGGRELLILDDRGRIKRVPIKPTKQSTFDAHRKHFVNPPTQDVVVQPSKAGKKVAVNKEFLRQVRAILMIIIPRTTCKEVFLLVLHTSFLLLRTYLSLLVAKLDGMIVKNLVSANLRGFLRGLAYWYLLAIPSTYTNSMVRFIPVPDFDLTDDAIYLKIRYLQQKLSISFRTRLTRCKYLLRGPRMVTDFLCPRYTRPLPVS